MKKKLFLLAALLVVAASTQPAPAEAEELGGLFCSVVATGVYTACKASALGAADIIECGKLADWIFDECYAA